MLHDSQFYNYVNAYSHPPQHPNLPTDMDDLHPNAWRCAKNSQWPCSPAAQAEPLPEQSLISLADVLADINSLASEIQRGFTQIVRKAETELALNNLAQVAPEDYDLYPSVYRAVKNQPLTMEEEDDLVVETLANVKTSLESVLGRLKDTIIARATEALVPTEDEAATATPQPDSADSSDNGDLDLYPALARARANGGAAAVKAAAEAQMAARPPSLGKEFIDSIQVALQALRRNWIHAQKQVQAKHEPDLYPDVYRFAKNHNAKLYAPPKGAQATVTDLFDSLTHFVAAAA